MLKLGKEDVARAMVLHHFTPCNSIQDAFEKLKCVQFDPIAPVGCNHDLVLQARVPGYRIGDWQKLTYEDRFLYDGWDKQACLVPMKHWPLHRIFHKWHRKSFNRVFEDHPYAVEAILKELAQRGPLLPKECDFQERKEEWKVSWHGPNLSKQTMRALWHTGRVMTAGRRKGHHVYDLTERIVPPKIYNQPELDDADAQRELVLQRHQSVGIIRPSAPYEMWSYGVLAHVKHAAIQELVDSGDLVAVSVDGVKAHATPAFLSLLDGPLPAKKVTFIAPLDHFMWDRKMIQHLFRFEYIWEIYTPEPKRRWGYYVLPILYGGALVARIEFWCRDGVLEVRAWHEQTALDAGFWEAYGVALRQFMDYCSAETVVVRPGIPDQIGNV